MTTSNSQKLDGDKTRLIDISLQHNIAEKNPPSLATAFSDENEICKLMPRSQFLCHHTKAGINPLVDFAGYLFSIIGKLKWLPFYSHLKSLQEELITEINTFETAARSQGYNSECILVSRYALCATLDDIISHTDWGSEGKWESYSLLTAFNQEFSQQERFFMVLERLVKDSHLYIDLMEFMYICLSLGFKGSNRATDLTGVQLEQICNALYRHIRGYHGSFSKTLSPPPIKHAPKRSPALQKTSVSMAILTVAGIILASFFSLEFFLSHISNQTYQELRQIGNIIQHETRNT